MIFFLMIILIFVVLLLLTWFSYIQIEVLFKREQQNDFGEIRVKALGGLLKFRYKLPKIKWSGLDEGIRTVQDLNVKTGKVETKQDKKRVQIDRRKIRKLRFYYHQILCRFHDFKKIMSWFLEKMTCEKFVWDTRIGTGDAAEAGFLTGMAYSVKYTLIGWLGNRIQWNATPELKVDPRFNEKVLEIYFHSIIRFRIGHAIRAVKQLSDHMRKGRIQ